ncbi:MAG: hypothetical protein RIC16_17260 [Rhodospirillales bacterium]
MPKYEIGVFNQIVRDRMKEGETHRFLKDEWAETHYFDVNASSEEAARRKITDRYSESEGYVIVSVELQTDD